jgi:hypothetical protein
LEIANSHDLIADEHWLDFLPSKSPVKSLSIVGCVHQNETLRRFLSSFSELTDFVLENREGGISIDILASLSPYAHSLKTLTLDSSVRQLPVRALDFMAFSSLKHLGLWYGFVVDAHEDGPPVNDQFVALFPKHVEHLVIIGEHHLPEEDLDSLRETLFAVMQHKTTSELSLNLINFIHFPPKDHTLLSLPSDMGIEVEHFGFTGYVSPL